MNISEMRFPRQLEAEGSAERIRGELTARTSRLRTGDTIDMPVITLSEPVKTALKQSRLQGRIRFGFEPVLQQPTGEKKGITAVSEQTGAPYGDRISPLLLFSNDGAERFYRHIEQVLAVAAAVKLIF